MQRALPPITKSALGRSRWIVEEPDVRRSGPTVDLRHEAVHAEVQDLIPTADSSIDPRFNRRSMREVVPIEQALTLRGIEVSRKLGEELGMSERAVQVDEEAGDRAGDRAGLDGGARASERDEVRRYRFLDDPSAHHDRACCRTSAGTSGGTPAPPCSQLSTSAYSFMERSKTPDHEPGSRPAGDRPHEATPGSDSDPPHA